MTRKKDPGTATVRGTEVGEIMRRMSHGSPVGRVSEDMKRTGGLVSGKTEDIVAGVVSKQS